MSFNSPTTVAAVVEHPGVIEDYAVGLSTLGGERALSQVCISFAPYREIANGTSYQQTRRIPTEIRPVSSPERQEEASCPFIPSARSFCEMLTVTTLPYGRFAT